VRNLLGILVLKLSDRDADERIILKWILSKQFDVVFNCVRTAQDSDNVAESFFAHGREKLQIL
jgi:hypothetical protein